MIIDKKDANDKPDYEQNDDDATQAPPAYNDVVNSPSSSRQLQYAYSDSGPSRSPAQGSHPGPSRSQPNLRDIGIPQTGYRIQNSSSTDSLHRAPNQAPSAGPSGGSNPVPHYPASPVNVQTQSPTSWQRSLFAPGPNGRLMSPRDFSPGESVSVLLNPPPPSFRRSPAPNLPYTPFEATALMGLGSDLTMAFPLIAPPCAASPHPFITHDVTEHDWVRFVNDAKVAGSLTASNSLSADIAPIARRTPFFLGLIIHKGFEFYWKSKQSEPVGELIDYWNHHFFHPRRLHIVLARGPVCFSGSEELPPDWSRPSDNELGSSVEGSDEDSFRIDEDSFRIDEDSFRIDGKGVRRESKAVGKATKKEEKRRKKQRKADISNLTNENWRLVVAHRAHP